MSKNSWSSWIKYAALGSSIATTLAGLVGGGYFLGDYLDSRWGTDPLLKIILMLVGVVLGIGYLIVSLNNLGKSKEKNDQ